MAQFKTVELPAVLALGAELQALGGQCPSLQATGQAVTDRLYEEFGESLALVRVFATLPYARLPEDDRAFVSRLAQSKDAAASLDDGTIVLSLLGTRGALPGWNDRTQSQGHLGIPLLSTAFVESIPMVTRLMQDLGLGIDWIDRRDTDIVVKTLGTGVGVFHVGEAATDRDGSDRLIVPDGDFVRNQGIKSVFGLSGGFLDGTLITCILFTKESLDREDVEKFMPMLSMMKTGMTHFRFDEAYFS